MKSKIILVAAAVAVAVPGLGTFEPAFAKSSQEQVYKRQPHHYRYRCKQSSGTTGAVVGGVGGAVIGHEVGGGLLGTLAGGAGGLLLGRHLDKKHDQAQNRRNGCA